MPAGGHPARGAAASAAAAAARPGSGSLSAVVKAAVGGRRFGPHTRPNGLRQRALAAGCCLFPSSSNRLNNELSVQLPPQFWMSAWELYGFARQAASLEAQARQPGLRLLTLRFEVGGSVRHTPGGPLCVAIRIFAGGSVLWLAACRALWNWMLLTCSVVPPRIQQLAPQHQTAAAVAACRFCPVPVRPPSPRTACTAGPAIAVQRDGTGHAGGLQGAAATAGGRPFAG